MALDFLAPWYLAAAGAVAIPVIIHLLQRRREVILPFPMVRFVLRARKRSSRRLQLKRLFLLALRMAAILIAAVILARPVLRSTASDLTDQGGYVALVLDNSLSTAARDGKGTAFDTLLEAASDVVRRSGEGTRFAPFWAVRPEGEHAIPRWAAGGEVLEELAGSRPLPGRGNFAGAFEQAYGALRKAPAGRRQIAVFTDLAEGSWEEFSLLSVAETDPAVPVKIFRTGVPSGGAGVVGITVDGESFMAGDDLQVSGRVVNWGPGEKVPVDLLVDGRREDRRIVTVPAGTEAKVPFVYRPSRRGEARLELRLPEDTYREDDRRFYGLEIRAPLEVLVVDGDPGRSLTESETFFVREALRGEGLRTLEAMTVRVAAAEELPRLELSAFDVVLLANVPAPEAGSGIGKFLSSGGGLAVFWGDNCRGDDYAAALPSVLPARIAGTEDAPGGAPFRVEHVDFDAPVFSVFAPPGGGTFATASFFRRARVVELSGGADAPAKFRDGAPWIVSGTAGKGRVVLCASTADLAWGDMPTKPVFVPLVRRTVLFLAGRLGSPPTGEVTAGDSHRFRGDDKDAFTAMTVTAPDGTSHRLELQPGPDGVAATFANTLQTGFYEWEGPRGKGVLAVNPPAEESDLRRVDDGELKSRFQGVPLDLFSIDSDEGKAELSQAGTRSLSRPLFTALFLLLVLEMIVAGPRARFGKSAGP